MMNLKRLKGSFSICRYNHSLSPLSIKDPFFLFESKQEVSLLCLENQIPAGYTHREDGWTGFYIEGSMPFTLCGVLASVLNPLAKAEVGILAQSTFDTDYIFVKQENLSRAYAALKEAGFGIEESFLS